MLLLWCSSALYCVHDAAALSKPSQWEKHSVSSHVQIHASLSQALLESAVMSPIEAVRDGGVMAAYERLGALGSGFLAISLLRSPVMWDTPATAERKLSPRNQKREVCASRLTLGRAALAQTRPNFTP